MHHYGVIGYPLEHSFSALLFNRKFAAEHIDAEFSLYPVAPEEKAQIPALIARLDGLTVTSPYKETVIPYLERLDETAAEIGAVNVIYQGTGYNTDYIGFMNSLRPLLRKEDKRALVLGTGGAAKAVCFGLQQLGISPTPVSRSPKAGMLGYSDLTAEVMDQHTIIVNCTPLGMLPNVNSCPAIHYERLTARHILYDCVYNPEETVFLRKGKAHGAVIRNGAEMLIGQAEAAWKIWKH